MNMDEIIWEVTDEFLQDNDFVIMAESLTCGVEIALDKETGDLTQWEVMEDSTTIFTVTGIHTDLLTAMLERELFVVTCPFCGEPFDGIKRVNQDKPIYHLCHDTNDHLAIIQYDGEGEECPCFSDDEKVLINFVDCTISFNGKRLPDDQKQNWNVTGMNKVNLNVYLAKMIEIF